MELPRDPLTLERCSLWLARTADRRGSTVEGVQMSAECVGREPRQGTDSYLPQRRGIVGISLAAIGTLSVVALHQTGITKHVPAPPLPGFDANTVDAAPEAYRVLRTQDTVLGIGSHAATVALAAMDGMRRAHRQPWLPLLTALARWATLPLTIPKARAALHRR